MKENADSARYLSPNDLARRFGAKPGFQLIDFTEVALPIFVLPVDAIVIASKPLQLVDEFLLRSIAEGVNTLDEVSGFLGLEHLFVKKRLGELIGQDLLAYGPTEIGPAKATLTAKGVDALKKALVVQPKRESFSLAIDGITRQALTTRPSRLLAVRDVRAFGLLEIRAFPEDKAPEFSEIAQMDLTSALAVGPKKEQNVQRVMSLVHMGRRLRRYREATMLVFRAEHGRQIHVEFFIDGRPSQTLNEAFARHDGVKALHIPEQVEASLSCVEQQIKSVLPNLVDSNESKQAATIRPKLQPFINRVGLLESKIEEKENSIEETDSRVEIELLKSEIAKLLSEKQKAEKDLNSLEIRYLEVHEHRPLFEHSLREAKQRLLLISPWIRDSVLNQNRLDKLKKLVEVGVEVFIGYGLGEDDKPGKDKGEHAIRFLEQLSRRHSNLHFHELGDTHAKILLVDDSYAVIGSFNWLSFEGSARRGFREEMSFRINKQAEIERLFHRYLARFPKQSSSAPESPVPNPNPQSFNGKYSLKELLGDGASGAVHRAVCLQDGKIYAVKVLTATGSQTLEAQFRRELEILQKLAYSNNVLAVCDFVREGEKQYLVLEYADGGNLHDYVKQSASGKLDLAESVYEKACIRDQMTFATSVNRWYGSTYHLSYRSNRCPLEPAA
ncbi:MAG: protein kinase domain-containing protein, partial [Limisphaerales bacterium]